jgi:hypothetical protein
VKQGVRELAWDRLAGDRPFVPPGIFWADLDEEKIAAVPVLRRLRG